MTTLREVPFPVEQPRGLGMHVYFDDSDSLEDIVDALALSPFATGEQPWARSARFDRLRQDAPLTAPGGRITRAAVTKDGIDARLYEGDGWTMRVLRFQDKSAFVSVTAVAEELAKTVLDAASLDAADPGVTEPDNVEMGFWWMGDQGRRRSGKPISTMPWQKIRGNYARAAQPALDDLMGTKAADVNGRILLLHGPPGTGKTTLLRTIAREWGAWCQVDCVLDPEQLFANPGYLMDVAMGWDGPGEHKWRLLVLEDCEELIHAEAKQATGQGLSRLLNLTDGLLGQGRDVLVAITTNEDLSRLHPAITRPGRCLARIEVGRMEADQAAGWLGRPDGVPAWGATLAELFALRDGRAAAADQGPGPETGQYL